MRRIDVYDFEKAIAHIDLAGDPCVAQVSALLIYIYNLPYLEVTYGYPLC